MRLLKLTIFLLFAVNCYSQSSEDIKYNGSYVVMRKDKENFRLVYSEKHDRIISGQWEFEHYPDSTYHVIFPVVNIFFAKEFKDDKEAQLNIRVDYMYYKIVNGKRISKQIERWSKSFYPSIGKVFRIDETSPVKGRVIYYLKNKAQIIIDNQEKGMKSIYYSENNEYSYLNYTLMFADCELVK